MKSIEIIATILAILSVHQTNRESFWCWITGGISSLLLIIVFLHSNLIFQSALQLLLVVQCIAGALHWGMKDDIKINNKYKERTLIELVASSVLVSGLVYFANTRLQMNLFYADAVIAMIGLWGNYYFILKRVQAWPVLMLFNALSVVLFVQRDLYVYAAVNVYLFYISIEGYKVWKRSLNTV